MLNKINWRIAIPILLIVLALIVSSWLLREKPTMQAVARKTPPLTVEVATAESGQFPLSIKALGKVVAREHINQGDKDFSAVLTKVKASGADVLYMSLQNHSSGSLMAIQAKRMGLDSKILSQDAMYHPNFISVGKEAAEGVYVTFGFTDESTPEYKKFADKFTAQYGDVGAYAIYSYDAATVLLNAIKSAGSIDPAKIKAEIMKMDFQGASKQVKFNEKGDSGSSYIAYKIEDGEYRTYWHPETGFYKK